MITIETTKIVLTRESREGAEVTEKLTDGNNLAIINKDISTLVGKICRV